MDIMMRQTDSNKKGKSAQPSELIELNEQNLTYTQGSGTRNTAIKQYLCVRNQVPKTALSHIILNENMSQDRQLERQLTHLSSRQHKVSNANDLSQRTFLAVQDRKQKKWRRDDEVRVGSMNFPYLHVNDTKPQDNMEVMYHLSEYDIKSPRSWNRSADHAKRVPKMPFSTRKEQTELVLLNNKSYMTKLPEVEVVDNHALKYYDTYRGKSIMSRGAPRTDDRFKRLENLLRPAHLTKSDQYNTDNIRSMSRLSKYSYHRLSTDPQISTARNPRPSPPLRERPLGFSRAQNTPGLERQVSQQSWMLTRPESTSDIPLSHPPSREILNMPNKPDTAKKNKKSVRILEEFKKGDVKQLAKCLKKDVPDNHHPKTKFTVKVLDGPDGDYEEVEFDG